MEGADTAKPLGPLGGRKVGSVAGETQGYCRIGALCLSRLPAYLSLLMCITGQMVSFSLGKEIEWRG